MLTQTITLNIPQSILLAEKMDSQTFAQELRMLAAVKLTRSAIIRARRRVSGYAARGVFAHVDTIQSLSVRSRIIRIGTK